jgi:F0F1-type ATP synthase assembly protein I
MTPRETRNWHQAEDDAWSRAMELALTPVVAGGIGYLADRILGIVPICTITFVVLAVVATFIKMYYAYDAKMKEHDAESPWGRARTHAAAMAAGAPTKTAADRTATAKPAADRTATATATAAANRGSRPA